MRIKIEQTTKQTVLGYLREKGIKMNAPCGGQGICGKCKVKLLQGEGAEAKGNLSEEDLQKGYRLACKLLCKEEMEIEIESNNEHFVVVTDFKGSEQSGSKEHTIDTNNERYGIAIDIGTTTLAFALIRLASKEIIDMYTDLNSGRICGADVISRIEYSNTHGVSYLKQLMIDDLEKGIDTLCQRHSLSKQSIERVVIAGNTTMLHLLVGVSCESLGVYPFEAVFIDEQKLLLAELLKNSQYEGEVILLPGLSTYVGADIVSGIMQCEMQQSESVCLLIDIGTNGEMVVGNHEKMLGLATAAGPAFEGGNISCGIGSIEGAICKVTGEDGQLKMETIGGKAPVGICGSGLIDLVACGTRYEWIDETGMIADDEDEITVDKSHAIYLTQKDIRQFQLAKSAIRAGIQILVESYGVTLEDIDTIYLAGGFGKFINLEHAIQIGLLPSNFEGKIKRVGNVALGGAIRYLTHANQEDILKIIKSISHELNLANQPKFNEYFIQYMLFEEE